MVGAQEREKDGDRVVTHWNKLRLVNETFDIIAESRDSKDRKRMS